jgi:hypothetical protein
MTKASKMLDALREGFASAFDFGAVGGEQDIARTGRAGGGFGQDARKLRGDAERVERDLLEAARKTGAIR